MDRFESDSKKTAPALDRGRRVMHVEVTDCRSSQQSSVKTRAPGCGSAAGHLPCGDCSARVAPVRPQLRKRRYFWNGTDKRHCTATDRARRRDFVLIIHADIVMESKNAAPNYPCAIMIAKLIRATVDPATTIMRKTCVHIAKNPANRLLSHSVKAQVDADAMRNCGIPY
jgi:hypothetical protein